MTRKDREQRRLNGRRHKTEQKLRLENALAESTAAAKRSKKGKAQIEVEMRKRGYERTTQTIVVKKTGSNETVKTTRDKWVRTREAA